MSSAGAPRVQKQGQQQIAKGSVSRKPVPGGDEAGESSTAQGGPRRAPSRQQRPQQQQQQSMVPASTEEDDRLPRTARGQESTAVRGRKRSAGPKRGMPRQPSTQGSSRQPAPGRTAENVTEASFSSRREPTESAPERPAALSTQQRKLNQGPPASARNQVSPDQDAPNFSFPKPAVKEEPPQAEIQANQTASRRGPPRGPLPSAPVAAVQGPSRQGPPIPAEALPVPRGPVPPVPTSSRSGQVQSSRVEQAVPVVLRPTRQQAMAPVQSFDQAQARRNMPQERNPAYPPPLRTANLTPNPPPRQTSVSAGGFPQTSDRLVSPQSALPQATYNSHVSAETSRSRNVVSPSKPLPPSTGSFSRKPVNSPPHQMLMNPLRSSPPNPPPPPADSSLPAGFSRNNIDMNPLRQSPPNPPQKPVMSSNLSQQTINPLRQSPPNPQVAEGGIPVGLFSQNPSAPPQRPALAAPPQRKEIAPLNITSSSRNINNTYAAGPSRSGIVSPPRVTSPPQGGYLSRNITSPSSNQDGGRYPTMPRAVVSPPYQPRTVGGTPPKPAYNQHSHSSSLDSVASSATATSTRPLNPTVQPSSSFSPPTRKNTDLSYSKPLYNTQAPQTPYMSILLSLDKIPRLHNILSTLFLFLLLAGYVIIPGSFTALSRPPLDPESAIPINLGANTTPDKKLLLTRANTATMVVGFVFIIIGTFGTAWLGLKWRRNYVWLLNKLYLPLVMYSMVGLVGTVVGVYAVQNGEWSTQAIIAGILEAVEMVVGGLLFGVYNVWLVQRVRQEGGGGQGGYDKQEKERGSKKKGNRRRKGGLMGRFRGWRGKRSIAVGSVV
ncbi:hypothetical protein QC761_201300 [Podospora bellae-mahoneyi]|uniref:Uncharacterized protein n=1 Tax=Podospora bellae-mahoneyi TaxID=2093777 RepID=A0ABR0FN79_9PEZI|nr:hypothetical protein QC761_201300 [Podospora bellae-mahoneyi]